MLGNRTPTHKGAKEYFANFGIERYIESKEMFNNYVSAPSINFSCGIEDKKLELKVFVLFFFVNFTETRTEVQRRFRRL